MKKIPSFSAFFMSILMVLFAASATWADELQLQGSAGNYYVNMPASGSHTLSIPDGVTSFHVYDNGGPGGTVGNCDECGDEGSEYNYNDYIEDAVLTIQAAAPLQVEGSINTEYGYDYLNIYDGETFGTPLWSQSDAEESVGPVVSEENSITLRFNSDGSNNRSGFELTVSVFDPSLARNISIESVNGGTLAVNKTTVMPGRTVTLTATPNSGHYLASVDVVDEENNSVTVTIDGNTATFVMPEYDVTVTPVFAEVSYGTNGCLAGGLYFHLECNGYSCTISQKAGTPSDDEDFACWSDLVDKIEEITENAYSNTINLGSSLEMGGYDGENCVMQDFRPIRTASFNGNNHVINGFCQVSSGDAGFLTMYTYQSASYFEKVTFTNAHVEGAVAGVLAADITDEVYIRNVVVDGVEVVGSTAGGLAGYIHYHSQYGYTSMLSNVTVQNSTIEARNVNSADSIQAGALWGKGVARQSRMIDGNSYSKNNTVKAADAGGAVVSLGGVVGVLLTSSNDANHQYLTLRKFDISNATLENTSTATESNIGGFAGLFIEGVAMANDSLELVRFDGSISGGTNVGGIVGKIDIPNISKLYIRNTMSTTTGLQGSDNVGYIVGDIEQLSAVKMYNNIYFGADVNTLGVGNIGSLNAWLVGSDFIYANVRNVAATLSATDDIGHYEYHNGNANYLLYFPVTSADNITRNGVALEEDMKTEMFVALMNKNAVMYGGEQYAQWSIDNAGTGYPVFADGVNGPYYVVSIDLDDSWSLTAEQASELGAVDGIVTIDGTNVVNSKTIIDYVPSSGTLSTTFVNNVNSLKDEVAQKLNVNSSDLMLMNGSGAVVNNLAAERISASQKLHIEGAESFNVVYNYCTSATACNTFESLADSRTFLFLSPKIEEISTSDPVPYQILPYAISLGETNTNLKIVSVKLYDDANALVKTFDGSSYATRLWQTTEITEFLRQKTATITRIEVNYQDQYYSDDVPEITAYASNASVHVYGVDGEGESQEAFSLANSSGRIPYGKITVSYDGTIPSRAGYKSEGMAIKYARNIEDSNGGDDDEELNLTGPLNEVLTEKTFGSIDELHEKFATNHESINLVVKGLASDDTVDINSLRIASSLADNYLSYEDLYLESHSLTVEPYYSLINYTVSFDLNAPGTVNRSDIFIGNSGGLQTRENVNLENGQFPKLYTTTCPSFGGWYQFDSGSDAGDFVLTDYFLSEAVVDADYKTTAYGAWNSENCSTPFTFDFSYWAQHEGEDMDAFPGSVVLKQVLIEGDTISHPMVAEYDEGFPTYYTTLPEVDDTLTFIVSTAINRGYKISGIELQRTFKTGVNENTSIAFNAPEGGDTTLTINTSMLNSAGFNISFDYERFWVGFKRPTDNDAVGVTSVDYYVAEEYTAENWPDVKNYGLGDANLDMPKLYALNGCVGWSEEPSYDGEHAVYRKFDGTVAQAYVNNMVLYPVYFTPTDNPNLCGDAPTETFTVTVHGANLNGMELRQIIGATGDGDVADTVKHQFTQDQDDETLWTLNIPKIAVQGAPTETYATMNFEIHAIPADGYATYSGSYYRLSAQEGGTLTIPYEDGILTTNGSNVTFFVNVVGGGYTVAFDTTGWEHIAESKFAI